MSHPEIDPAFVSRIWATHPNPSLIPKEGKKFRPFFVRDPKEGSIVWAKCDQHGRLYIRTGSPMFPGARKSEPSYAYVRHLRPHRKGILRRIREVGQHLTDGNISATDAEILLDLLNLEYARLLT